MVILQDSCKFVPVELSSYWLSFMQHISFWPEIYLRISCVFFLRKIIILNGFKIWKYELSEENKLKSAFENCLHKTNYYQKLFSFNFIKIYKNYV